MIGRIGRHELPEPPFTAKLSPTFFMKISIQVITFQSYNRMIDIKLLLPLEQKT